MYKDCIMLGDGMEYTVKEFAKEIGISEETLRRWDRTGKLKCDYRSKSGYRIYTDKTLVEYKSGNNYIVSREFDDFKSSVCHHVKYDLKNWFLDVLENQMIEKYLGENKPEYAYYTLAMLDKMLKEHDLPLPDDYEWMRKTKLSSIYYPCSHVIIPIDLKTADMDFLKYNIVEEDNIV